MPPSSGSVRGRRHAGAEYGADYWINYLPGRPYGRDEAWLEFFRMIADRIVADIQPKTVLDAGCAMGFLVEALRDRGVEAYGFDISEYALERVRPDIRDYVWKASALDPLDRRYDLLVSIEVLEHMPAAEGEKAIANLTGWTDDLIFSSTPGDFDEPTHFNVRPPEYWTELFAREGMYRDVDYDLSTWLAPWAVRYRRAGNGFPRVVAGYERRLWQLTQEVLALREGVQEIRTARAERQEMERELTSFKATTAYFLINSALKAGRRMLPIDSRAGRAVRRLFGGRRARREDGG